MLESTVRTDSSHSVTILLSKGGVAGDARSLCFLRFLVFYSEHLRLGRVFIENYSDVFSTVSNVLQ